MEKLSLVPVWENVVFTPSNFTISAVKGQYRDTSIFIVAADVKHPDI